MSESTMAVNSGPHEPLDFDRVEEAVGQIAEQAERRGVTGWDVAAYLRTEGGDTSRPQVVGTIIRVYDKDPAKAVATAMPLVPKFENATDGGTLSITCAPIGDHFYEDDE